MASFSDRLNKAKNKDTSEVSTVSGGSSVSANKPHIHLAQFFFFGSLILIIATFFISLQ